MFGMDMKLASVEKRKIARQKEEKRKKLQKMETVNFSGNF